LLQILIVFVGQTTNYKTTKITTSKTKKNIKNLQTITALKSVFLVHHYTEIDKDHNVESVFLVHHYYNKNQTFNVLILPMASKKIPTLKIKISTTYG
jgi:metal-responsive CopG/Arc/MetJ family transcriptional regulator